MLRRYNRWHSRFDQPDPSEGSYHFSDPQSLNRYAYVSNDPVSFTDPTGLEEEPWDPGESIRINTSVRGLFGAGGGGIRGNPDPEIEIGAGTEPGEPSGPPTQPPPPADPCAGRKGSLFYPFTTNAQQQGIGAVGKHITERHISQTLHQTASKYVFLDINLHRDQSNSAMIKKGRLSLL